MVSSVTFRQPGPLAITVATVDAMSGGRVELGLGSGWFGVEHTSYGIPFPPVGERFDLLEEQLAIVTGLWATPPGETFSFSGAHYSLADSPALPKPVQSPAAGHRRRQGPDAHAGAGRAVRRGVQRAVRHPRGHRRLLRPGPPGLRGGRPGPVVAGAVRGPDPRRRRRRARGTPAGRGRGRRRRARCGSDGLGGTPAEVVDKLGRLAELGAERVYLQVMDLADLDHLGLVAAEVAPHALTVGMQDLKCDISHDMGV